MAAEGVWHQLVARLIKGHVDEKSQQFFQLFKGTPIGYFLAPMKMTAAKLSVEMSWENLSLHNYHLLFILC